MRARIFLLAAGRVGQALGLALQSRGAEIIGLWRRKPAQAEEAAARLGIPGYAGPLPAALREAELVLCCPPERAVNSLARAASEEMAPGAVLLHTAGSLPPAPLAEGVHSGVLHPLQSIADATRGAALFAGVFFAISGDPPAREAAQQLALLVEGRPVEVRDPALYHLGAVLASNSLYPLFAAATGLLVQAGVSEETAAQMLLPLVRGSLDNLAALGPARGMTGPVARADPGTIARHLDALTHAQPSLLPLYRALTEQAVELARANGADPHNLAAISSLLF